uniref:RING-type E3 ubiquitin transferase n=1 Tax=Araucaria cunninghamii TaxID=56994 RepID=A0A0D6QYW3_ARACU
MEIEDTLKQNLQDLQKQLGKKQTFESAAACLASMLRDHYASASPSLQHMMYTAICRVATLLQTRYVAPGFWITGMKVFEEADKLVCKPAEKDHIKVCISKAQEHLQETDDREDASAHSRQNTDSRFLFDGQLTVGPEPPPPRWFAAQNFLTAVAMGNRARSTEAESTETSTQDGNAPESTGETSAQNVLEQVINNLQGIVNFESDIESAIEAALQEVGGGARRAPPASKEVVAKLPIIDVTEEVLAQIGKGTECAVCQEHLIIGDKMQELPCKHMFHPVCLKPWLDENNSCPICRHELQTDDHEYEFRKEREKEAEEERKGAANAIRGGEYMYV